MLPGSAPILELALSISMEAQAVDIQRIGDTRDILGEGPVWCPREQALYWVDIRRPCLQRYDARSKQVTSWDMPELVGSLALCEAGGLLLALRSSLSRFDPVTGHMIRICAPEAERPNMRFNDGKCDRQGRFWVGTMNDVTREPTGSLYRLDANGDCRALAQGITIPNSLAWSPDDQTMYFADSFVHTIFNYPFDSATGNLGARRAFAKTLPPAIPDGATVDTAGFLWSAHYDGWRITRYSPDGRIARTIDLPVQRPTSCAFGGPDLDILYVTTASQRLSAEELAQQPLAGALLALDVGVRGLPEPRYVG